MKPVILITMGDPNGVGPEICAQSLCKQSLHSNYIPVLIGNLDTMKQAARSANVELSLHEVSSIDQIDISGEITNIINPCTTSFTLNPGAVSSDAGAAALAYITYAVQALKSNKASAMVTAPICKESIEPLVPGFQGHTEYIGEMCGDPHPVLTLIEDNWVISHVSTHVSLREAIDRVQVPRILKTGQLLHDVLQKLTGKEHPRIGVAGLNPHAGENGLFGKEEIEIISPAIKELQQQGINAFGPLPADVVFPQMKAGTFDGVIAMYHDQGHIVTKTLSFSLGEKRSLHGVNATLGLDIIRTSVDHGTGFDIAWKGIADNGSMLDAIKCAITLSQK